MKRVTPDMVFAVDEFLAFDKFDVDEKCAHIEVDLDGAEGEFDKLMLICPAGLYKRSVEGIPIFDYVGCLECGTCRICCGDTIIKKWQNPSSLKGVEYRYG
jgi:ferredoxin-like protein FixX